MMIIGRKIITRNSQETVRLGETFLEFITTNHRVDNGRATIICLNGELGSGKTTFVQGMARGLNISSRLLSPTYIIVRRYWSPTLAITVYHYDLYRLTSENELPSLGFIEAQTDSSALVAIEWPDKLGKYLPPKRFDLYFSITSGEKRIIRIENLYAESD